VGVVHVNLFGLKCFHALGLVSHKVLNSWAKSVNNKTCLNWVFLKLLQIFLNTNIKSVFTFFNLKLKRMVKSQIDNLIIDH
jgi:hypothetical protein